MIAEPVVRQVAREIRTGGQHGKFGEEIAEVGEGFDLVGFATGGQGEQHGGGAVAVIAAKKSPVLAADGASAKRPLGEVVVDRQCAIFAVTNKTVPAWQDVPHGLAHGAFRQHVTRGRADPFMKRV